jgi:hypothetical protein
MTLPFKATYPALNGQLPVCSNEIGFRVMPSEHVHAILRTLDEGRSPSVDNITATSPLDPADARSTLGWRLERFIADEVLRCRHGRMFEDLTDPNLRGLLYERSAPIAAAITITIDLGEGG